MRIKTIHKLEAQLVLLQNSMQKMKDSIDKIEAYVLEQNKQDKERIE